MSDRVVLGLGDLVLPGATLGNPPLLEHVRLAADNGFAGVSIRAGDYSEALAGGLTDGDIRFAIADAGLLVADIDCVAPVLGSGEPGGEFYGATEDDVLRCAEALGARSVNLILQRNREAGAGGVSGTAAPDTHEAVVEAAAADCARVADRAADIGVLVHLEPIPFMDVKDAVTALEIAAEADRPNLGIQIDAWHHFRGPIPASAATAEVSKNSEAVSLPQSRPATSAMVSQASDTQTSQSQTSQSNKPDVAETSQQPVVSSEDMAQSCAVFLSFPGQHIFAIQVCDAGPPQGRPFEDTMKRRLFPGEGEFPLATLVATLRLIGCQAPISVEVFADPLTPDQLTPAAQAARASQAAQTTRTLLEESATTLKTIMSQLT